VVDGGILGRRRDGLKILPTGSAAGGLPKTLSIRLRFTIGRNTKLGAARRARRRSVKSTDKECSRARRLAGLSLALEQCRKSTVVRVASHSPRPRDPHRRDRHLLVLRAVIPATRCLRAGLAAVLVNAPAPELALVHRWLDTWAGLGLVVAGMARQRWDLQLTA
jgi:hypothetical protein